MEKNFCQSCELELRRIFKEEFKENLRIEEGYNYTLCLRNYVSANGKLNSCLSRLTRALLNYIKKTQYHYLDE
jgi:hypothetical protein